MALVKDLVLRTSGPQAVLGPATVKADDATTYYRGGALTYRQHNTRPGVARKATSGDAFAGFVREQVTLADGLTGDVGDVEIERPDWVWVTDAHAELSYLRYPLREYTDDDTLEAITPSFAAAAANGKIAHGRVVEVEVRKRYKLLLDYGGQPVQIT